MLSTALEIVALISTCKLGLLWTNDGSRDIWPSRYLCTSSFLARTSNVILCSNNFVISGLIREVVKIFAPVLA